MNIVIAKATTDWSNSGLYYALPDLSRPLLFVRSYLLTIETRYQIRQEIAIMKSGFRKLHAVSSKSVALVAGSQKE